MNERFSEGFAFFRWQSMRKVKYGWKHDMSYGSCAVCDAQWNSREPRRRGVAA